MNSHSKAQAHDLQEMAPDEGRGFDAAVRWAGRWFVGGMSTIGFALGWFTGMSNTPVVGALLPLLIGGIGGGAGLLLGKAKLDSALAAWRVRSVGAAAIAFGVLSILGALLGSAQRAGTAPPIPESVRIDLNALDVLEQVQLILLRDRLKQVGVSDGEQAVVLATSRASLLETREARAMTELDSELLAEKVDVLVRWLEGQDDDRGSLGDTIERLTEARILLAETDSEALHPLVRLAIRDSALSDLDEVVEAMVYTETMGYGLGYDDPDLEEFPSLEWSPEALRARAIIQGRDGGGYSIPMTTTERAIELLGSGRTEVNDVQPVAIIGRGLAST